VADERRGRFLEGLFELQALAGAGCHLLAAGGEIFFERFCVPRKLCPELFDLSPQIFGDCFARCALCLTLLELLALHLDHCRRGAGLLEHLPRALAGPVRFVGA